MSLDRRAFHRAVLGLLCAPWMARAQPKAADSPHRALYLLQGADRRSPHPRWRSPGRPGGHLHVAQHEGFGSLHRCLREAVRRQDAALARQQRKGRAARGHGGARRPFRLRRPGDERPRDGGALPRKLLDEFRSPHFRDLPPAAFPKHRHYVADRFNFFTIGYNTNLVKPHEVPNSYDDLLHPRFAGRVGVEAGDVDWFGAMVKHMGEEQGLRFFRKLAEAKPQIRSGHTLMGELISSGEIPLAANIYNHNVERLTVKGAPIRWKALKPTFGRPNAIGVARRAPHPNAALLFADFMLSPEGQRIIRDSNRVPSSLAVNSNLNTFPFEVIDPVITLDEDQKWAKIWSDLFLKGQRVKRDVG